MIGSWLYHHFGIGGSGPWYAFWSGAGSDVGEITIVAGVIGLLRHINCVHTPCWRLSRHVTADGHKLCRVHLAMPKDALNLPVVHQDHQKRSPSPREEPMADTAPSPFTSARPAGKRGKRPAVHVPEIKLSLFRGAAPTPPVEADVTHGITAWEMLGNDTYGDCGPAATMHYRMAKEGSVNTTPPITTESTESLYFAYGTAQGEPGPKPDEGVDNASWLKWLFDQGVIEAYAEVDFSDVAEVHQAMIDFSGVLIGVNLTDDAEQLFSAGQPWTLANGESPDPDEGHDILLAKYDDTFDYFITWGAVQPATIPWDSSCIDEAWVIITSDDAARAGVDMASLVAKIQQLGGASDVPPAPTPAPVPEPSPSPEPTPTPAPVPEPVPTPTPPAPPTPLPPSHETWWQEVLAWIKAHLGGAA